MYWDSGFGTCAAFLAGMRVFSTMVGRCIGFKLPICPQLVSSEIVNQGNPRSEILFGCLIQMEQRLDAHRQDWVGLAGWVGREEKRHRRIVMGRLLLVADSQRHAWIYRLWQEEGQGEKEEGAKIRQNGLELLNETIEHVISPHSLGMWIQHALHLV